MTNLLKEKQKEYYLKNREKILNQQKEYYKNNSEKYKNYYLSNKDKIIDRNKNYYIQNREKIIDRQKNYYKNNITKMKNYYLKNKEYFRDNQLKRVYNITLEQFNEYKNKQNNCCFVCEKSFENITAHLDHNHDTGKIRKVLCRKCNIGLGMFDEDEINIIHMSMYIVYHNLMEKYEKIINFKNLNSIREVIDNLDKIKEQILKYEETKSKIS